MRWRPGKVVARFARAFQAEVARQIRAAAPRVGGRPGQVGGSLAQQVLDPSLVQEKPWGAVLRWSAFYDSFVLRFFSAGTRRQKARPINFAPDVRPLVRELERDAMRHYARQVDERDTRARRRQARS